jgi:hypothetical protein
MGTKLKIEDIQNKIDDKNLDFIILEYSTCGKKSN